MITERDIKILRFISDFNFAKTQVVSFNIFPENKTNKGSSNAARFRLKNLENLKLLKSERDPSDLQKIFYLTSQGLEFLKNRGLVYNDLQIKEGLHWPTFKHDCLVLEVYGAFKSCGFNQGFSERAIRRTQLLETEIPDLLIWTKEGYIATEIELTQKSSTRIQNKLKELTKVESIIKVVYFYETESIKNAITKAMDFAKLTIQAKKNIHTYNIKDFLKEPDQIIKRILV